MINREYLESLQSFKTEEEYRNSSSLNYSTLKDIPFGPQCLVADRQMKSSAALEVGDYVDRYFTRRDTLNEVYDIAKPKIELSESLNNLYDHCVSEGKFEPTEDEVVEMCRKYEIYSTVKDDSKLKARITPDFYEKLRRNLEPNDKILITTDQLFQATCAIENITSDMNCLDMLTEKDGEIIIPQFKFEFELPMENSGNTRKFKIMIDILKFDLNRKKIFGIDIKSGLKPSNRFDEQFVDFRYDIQGILYLMGIMALRKQYFPEWEKVVPEDFSFIYSPKKQNSKPIIVSLTEDFINRCGVSMIYNGKSYDGIFKIINDTDWYIENQEFENHILIAKHKGKLTISHFDI